jgi:integrase
MSASRKDPTRGTWYFVEDVPSPNGKRRQLKRRGFPTKKAAEQARRELLASAEHGTLIDLSRLTVGEYLTARWLPSLDDRNLRATTLANGYRPIVKHHLVPHLGTLRLQALDTAAIEQMLAELARVGRSAKTRRNVHGVLSKSLADALRWRLVQRNVATDVELPRRPPPAPRAWNAEQVDRFLERAEEEPLAALWRFVVVTGTRRGEVLGLRWSDLDLELGVATITNQRAIAGGSVVQGAPKTAAGARTVALDAATVEALRTHRVAQRAEFMRLGVRPDHDLVFTGREAKGIWPQRITARFRDLSDELGLPRIGVHGLRHSAATWMISHGLDAKVVAQRLGHAHVSITLGLYTHVLPAHDRAAVDAFASALSTSRARRRDQSVTTTGEEHA